MFICNSCLEKNWPSAWGMVQSYGPCEVCGYTCVCFDIPSSQLPSPTKEEGEAKDE